MSAQTHAAQAAWAWVTVSTGVWRATRPDGVMCEVRRIQGAGRRWEASAGSRRLPVKFKSMLAAMLAVEQTWSET